MTAADPAAAPARRLPAWVVAALLVVLVAAAHLHAALSNGFANDDLRFLVHNRFVHGEGAWWRAFVDDRTIDPENAGAIVRPLRTLLFRAEWAVGGGAPLPFHLVSLALHATAAVLVWRLLRRLLRHDGAAWWAAAVWALHPMQTEVVDSIASQGDSLLGLFTVGALLAAARERPSPRALAGGILCGALAMLSKETAVVLPVLVVAVRAAVSGDWRAAARAAVPWVLLAAAYLVFRAQVVPELASHVQYRIGGSVEGTLATMTRALGAYLLFVLLPARPGVDWYLPASHTLTEPGVVAWGAVHVGLAVVVLREARRGRAWPAAAWLLFHAALLPVANWPFDLGIPTTERFLHLPLLGAALAAGAALRSVRPVRRVAQAAAVSLACLGVLSAVRAREWRDDDALYAATLRSHESVRGRTYVGATRRDEALALRAEARAATDDAQRAALETRADAALRESLAASLRAVELWKQQISPWPPFEHIAAVPLLNATSAALLLRDDSEARRLAEETLRITPRYPNALYNAAWARLRTGDPRGAAEAMRAALVAGMAVDRGEAYRFFTAASQALRRAGDTAGAQAAEADAERCRPR